MFHWGLFYTSSPIAGVLFHVVDNDNVWEYRVNGDRPIFSQRFVVAVKITTLQGLGGFDIVAKSLDDTLKTIPLVQGVHKSDFRCGIWFSKAINLLSDCNYFTCPDVSALINEIYQAALRAQGGYGPGIASATKCQSTV